jgi:hypothetical protein
VPILGREGKDDVKREVRAMVGKRVKGVLVKLCFDIVFEGGLKF